MKIAIVGAGSIGCYLGGLLAASPANRITLVGRPALMYAVDTCGLTVGVGDGPRTTIPADRLTLATDATAARDSDVVIVTVKAKDTTAVGTELAGLLPSTTPILCLQNGLHGTQRLADAMPDHHVYAGMVPFNVVHQRPATLLRMTSGDIMIDATPALAPLVASAAGAELTLIPRPDMPAVHAAKLLLNLNNAINALSGLPLKRQLADRDYRRVLAASQREALVVYAASGLTPARLTPLPPAAMARILEAPTPIFTLLARTALSVHPDARSSMADDLDRGRRTEIDDLQGEVVRLGRAHGIPTPVNERIVALIKAAEAESKGPDRKTYSGPALRAAGDLT